MLQSADKSGRLIKRWDDAFVNSCNGIILVGRNLKARDLDSTGGMEKCFLSGGCYRLDYLYTRVCSEPGHCISFGIAGFYLVFGLVNNLIGVVLVLGAIVICNVDLKGTVIWFKHQKHI